MHRSILLLAICAAFAAVACSDSDAPGTGESDSTGGDVGDFEIAPIADADDADDAEDDTGVLPDAVIDDDTGDDTSDVTDDVEEDAEDATIDDAEDAPDGGEDAADAPDTADVADGSGDASSGGVGDPCDGADDCESGICWPLADGSGACTDTCDGDCPDGWSCDWTVDGEGERGRLCLPDDDLYCSPCAVDSTCGPGAACLAQADGSYCAPRCGPGRACPIGASCAPSEGDAGPLVCIPDAGRCIGCRDGDGDGQLAVECGGDDCAPSVASVYTGAEELCNGRDDDCDLSEDEDFDLATDIDHCGECGAACSIDNGSGGCFGGACGVLFCDDGFANCNDDASDGCEVELDGPDGCGVCPPPEQAPGMPCGTCGSGAWACADGASFCEGDLGEEARNACGGCAELPGEPAEICGSCDSGIWVCDGTERLTCDGDLGEDVENPCGGCEPLEAEPGDRCGTCGSGTWVCGGTDTVDCIGDGGDDARNECGGCAPLEGVVGRACGACDSGVWACESPEAVTCDGDGGASARNRCGGCETLDGAPGEVCGACGFGTLTCEGLDALDCDGDIVPAPDVCPPAECEGRLNGQLGEVCDSTSDCCDGLCVSPRSTEFNVCSETCSRYSDCNPTGTPRRMACQDIGVRRLCTVDDWGTGCATGAECVSGLCLLSVPGGACTWECSSGLDCRPGQACGGFTNDDDEDIQACTTMGEDCSSPDFDCPSGLCLTTGLGAFCTIFCDPGSPAPCPSGYRCEVAVAGEPPLCNR